MTDAAEGAADAAGAVEGVPAELVGFVDEEMFTEFQRNSQLPVETRTQAAPPETE